MQYGSLIGTISVRTGKGVLNRSIAKEKNIRCADTDNEKICRKVVGSLPTEDIDYIVNWANKELRKANINKSVTKADLSYERNYIQKPVCVFGELNYKNEAQVNRQFRFFTEVYLGEPLPTAPAPPTAFYELYLEAGKEDYVLNIPLAQSIKPGEIDHFLVRVATNKSAVFDINMKMIDTGGNVISNENVNLDIIIPRPKRTRDIRQPGEK